MKAHENLLLAVLVFVISLPITSFGQNSNEKNSLYEIRIDFKNKTAPILPDTIKKGQYYQLVIDSINKSLYKISINTSDTQLLKPLNIPNFSTLNIDAVTGLMSNLIPLETKSVISIDSLFLMPSHEETINIYITNLDNHTKQLFEIKTNIDSFIFDINLYQLQYKKEFIEEKLTTLDYNSAIKQVTELRNNINILLKEVFAENSAYLKYSKENEKPIAENKKLKQRDKTIKTGYSELITKTNEAGAIVSVSKADSILSSIVLLDNNKDYTYRSMPFQFSKDQASLKISIEPWKDDMYLQSYESEYKFPLTKKTYFGVGISFYGATLTDDVYSTAGTVIDTTTTIYSLEKEISNKGEFGTVALVQIGMVLGKKENFGAHFAFGPGISFTKTVKPRLFVGIGGAYGKTHMLMVDLGLVVGYVDKLSSVYNTGVDYTQKPENVTVSKTNYGIFFSIGYMFKIN